MLKSNQTFIGFDYGTKYIGIAVGQTLTCSANPLSTVTMTHGQPPWDAIKKIIEPFAPHAFVVGIPYKMDDSKFPITHAAMQFARELEQQFHKPVYQVDERLTTKSARQEIFERQGYKGLKKDKVDAYAAKLILESWLEKSIIK